MNITKYALHQTRLTVAAIIIIVCGGLFAYHSLPRAEDPEFIWRVASVTTLLPGASPERMEELVTDKLEKVIQEMPEVNHVVSHSSTGTSLVYVSIKDRYKQIRPIWDSLRRKVDGVKADLPDGAIGPVVNDDFGDIYGTILAVTGEGATYGELKQIADEVRNELLLLEDTAKVNIIGAQTERIFIEYQAARLAEYGISPGYLSQVLGTRNIISPGGHVLAGQERQERYVVEPSGNFESLTDIQDMIIQIPGSEEVVYLKDLADVSHGYIDPPETIMRAGPLETQKLTTEKPTAEWPCLGLAISLQQGGNIQRLGRKIDTLISQWEERYPLGIDFKIIVSQSEEVRRKVEAFIENLICAILIVMLVMICTLGLRTGLVVGALIPMTMLMSLMIMAAFNVGLNQVSLAALIIALGMLVDNAIVVSELIMVQMQEGKTAEQAAADAAQELQIPLLTSSLTTIAAFLPVYLADSSTGEYCIPIFTVVAITLLSSWFLALTMTPMLCVRFLQPSKPQQTSPLISEYTSRFYRGYRRVLLFLLHHTVITTIGVGLIFLLALQGFWVIPAIFFPPNDKATFTAEFSFPAGTAIETTEKMVKQVEAYIHQELTEGDNHPEGITTYGVFIGESAPLFVFNAPIKSNAPEYAMFLCQATSLSVMKHELIPKLEQYMAQTFPEVRSKIAPLQLSVPVKYPIEIRIIGPDLSILADISGHVKKKLGSFSGVKNIHDDWGLQTKKVLVQIDQARAYRAGLTNQDVAVSLQAYLTGFRVSQYREDDQVIPIVMRSIAEERDDIERLETHQIFSQSRQTSVPLAQVAEINVVWQPAKIMRRDRVKTITVQADVAPGQGISTSSKIRKWLASQKPQWKSGYDYELGGETEGAIKANKSLLVKFPIAGLIIVLLMIAQFNSFRKPLIILVTIPLGLIGVIVGLLLTGSYFGFMTLLGVISLSGIVVNDAIVLIDRIHIEQTQFGRDPQTAIIEATQRRLRPILLTTVTTVCGLIPLWFRGGPLWESMAIAIIFGLSFATLLTLGVVPVLYALCFKVSFKGYMS